MKKFRLFLLMLSAAVLPFTACQTGNEGTDDNGGTPDPVIPTVEVTLVEGSVTSSGFQVNVTTANVEAAKWYLASSDEDVTAETVFGLGTPLTTEQLNTTATVSVEAMAGLDFHFYVAVSKGETNVLSQALPVTTPTEEVVTPSMVEFYANTAVEEGGEDMVMTYPVGQFPGNMFYIMTASGDEACITMFDYDYQAYGCESYSYLTAHETPYPLVAGNVNMGNIPTTSCLLVDMGYTNFCVNGVYWYPVAKETDADGVPYGVSVMTTCNEGKDLNMLMFYLPVVDNDGNESVLTGQVYGPLGYTLAPSKMSKSLDLAQFGFTSFAATKDGDVLTLVSTSNNGKLTLNLDLPQNNGELASEDGVTWMAMMDELDQPCGSVTGELVVYGLDGEDDQVCVATTGQFTLYTTATAGEYTLTVARRELTLSSDTAEYKLAQGDYTVTVTGL